MRWRTLAQALVVLLAACQSYELSVDFALSEEVRAATELVEFNVLEVSGERSCDDIAFGRVDPAELALATSTRLLPGEDGGDRLRIPRSGTKLVWATAEATRGRLAAGCAAVGEVDGELRLEIEARPSAGLVFDQNLDRFRRDAAYSGGLDQGPLPNAVTLTVRDAFGMPVTDGAILWTSEGASESARKEGATPVQATGAATIDLAHLAEYPPGPHGVELRYPWLKSGPIALHGFRRPRDPVSHPLAHGVTAAWVVPGASGASPTLLFLSREAGMVPSAHLWAFRYERSVIAPAGHWELGLPRLEPRTRTPSWPTLIVSEGLPTPRIFWTSPIRTRPIDPTEGWTELFLDGTTRPVVVADGDGITDALALPSCADAPRAAEILVTGPSIPAKRVEIGASSPPTVVDLGSLRNAADADGFTSAGCIDGPAGPRRLVIGRVGDDATRDQTRLWIESGGAGSPWITPIGTFGFVEGRRQLLTSELRANGPAIVLWRSVGEGFEETAELPLYGSPLVLSSGRLDGDTEPDLIALSRSFNRFLAFDVQLFIRSSDPGRGVLSGAMTIEGPLGAVASVTTHGIELADFDGNGIDDVVVWYSTSPVLNLSGSMPDSVTPSIQVHLLGPGR